jgi:hypothetical protein
LERLVPGGIWKWELFKNLLKREIKLKERMSQHPLSSSESLLDKDDQDLPRFVIYG